MTDRELIEQLRELAEWAAANEWETPIMLWDVLTMAADRLEQLSGNGHFRSPTKMVGKEQVMKHGTIDR